MSICIKDQIQNMNLVIGCTVGCAYCYARNNVKRWHMIDDFADPEFFPDKLKMMEKKRPQNFLLTGMSDLSGWKPEWRDEVFAKIRENPQHQFLFLTKRPDLLDFDTDLENAWFGVTVTRKAELWRIDALRKNVRAKHYHPFVSLGSSMERTSVLVAFTASSRAVSCPAAPVRELNNPRQ